MSKLPIFIKIWVYLFLIKKADKILKRVNPCKWENGVCLRGREGGKNGCCSGCGHLGQKGCKTKCLACKIWVCNENMKLLYRDNIELIEIKTVCKTLNIPLNIRMSLRENFQVRMGND